MFLPRHLPRLARRITPAAVGLLILSATHGGLPVQESVERTIDVRIVNDRMEVVVDGERIPAERVRRTDFGAVVLDESGAPIPGLRIEMPNRGAVAVFADESGEVRAVPAGADTWVEAVDGRMLVMTDRPESASRPVMLGIRMEQTPKGVGVVDVIPGTPAATAGLRAGDVILSHEDVVLTPDRLGEKLRGFKAGQVVAMRVLRDGEVMTPKVRLGEWNDAVMGATTATDERSEAVVEMRFETDGTEDLESLQRLVEELMRLQGALRDEDDHRDHDDRHRFEERYERDEKHEYEEKRAHHGEIDPDRILEILKKFMPELFMHEDVEIEVERHEDGFELEIEVGRRHDDHDDDDHDGGDHHDEDDWHDERDHHDGGDWRHEYEGHAEETWQAIEELHHRMEEIPHEMHEHLEHVVEMFHERIHDLERSVEERLREMHESREMMMREIERAFEERGREFERAFEERGRQVEETLRRRDQRLQDAGQMLGDRLGTAGEEMGEAMRRLWESNRMLDARLRRLEEAMRMNRRPQEARDERMRPRPEDSDRGEDRRAGRGERERQAEERRPERSRRDRDERPQD